MNTPYEDGDRNNLRYAEYVLGVLDADARAAVAREVATNDEAAVAVALWQRRLTPLTDSLPEVAPSPDVWSRIRERLRWDGPGPSPESNGLWNSLGFWRWLGVGTSVVAMACLVMLLGSPLWSTREGVHGVLLVSSIREESGAADWTATVDLDRKEIVVVPAAAIRISGDRSTQLWLIPAGQAPISVGVFKHDTTTILALSPELLARLGPTAALAVSVEPQGGSPTGQPTGPVIAKGAISAARA